MQLIDQYAQMNQEQSAVQSRKFSPFFYLLLSLPLGIVYFTFVIVGVSLSAALTPIFVGIPLLLITFGTLNGMMRFERSLAVSVLGEPRVQAAPEGAEISGLFRRLGAYLTNPKTYVALLLVILKLPLGIVNFTVAVTLTCVSIGLIFTPAVYWAIDQSLGINIFEQNMLHDLLQLNVTPLQESLMYSAVGVVLLLISLFIIRVLAEFSARITLLAVEYDL